MYVPWAKYTYIAKLPKFLTSIISDNEIHMQWLAYISVIYCYVMIKSPK